MNSTQYYAFTQYARDTANSLGGLQANPDTPLRNDQYDAYRHALLSAKLAALNESLSKTIMDDHENRTPNNPAAENNMDRFNNNVGREEYKKWSDATNSGQTKDSLEKWIYDRVKEGKTINDLKDSRKWNEPKGALEKIKDAVATPYDAARAVPPPRVDPLILDLNGNGIETVAPNAANPILFDHNGDGIKSGTGWVAATDGMLVLDRNGNGTIDNGTELFGDSTQLAAGGNAADGFAALAGQDSNGDGAVNALDANFAGLKVWQDLNQDGISQAGELKTLTELGIASLSVGKTLNSSLLANGNQIADLGRFVRTDGTTAVMADINLAADTFHRSFTDLIPANALTATLNDMQGSVVVNDVYPFECSSGREAIIHAANDAVFERRVTC